ncbi:MAG: hypothetical protein Q9M28_09340 [Mariprofundaceae bacterium]|nr:hypothetical protein [Mariprofundaceae bacterium]
MSLNQVLSSITGDVEGALACGVVDLSSGMLLGVAHNVPYFTQSYMDAVGAAAVDLFRGRNITAVEKMLGSQRGEQIEYHITEMQMTSDNTYHFISIVPNKPDALLVLVTNRKTNLGMGWAAVRRNLPDVTPHCP